MGNPLLPLAPPLLVELPLPPLLLPLPPMAPLLELPLLLRPPLLAAPLDVLLDVPPLPPLVLVVPLPLPSPPLPPLLAAVPDASAPSELLNALPPHSGIAIAMASAPNARPILERTKSYPCALQAERGRRSCRLQRAHARATACESLWSRGPWVSSEVIARRHAGKRSRS
jgi:hypothetical protein